MRLADQWCRNTARARARSGKRPLARHEEARRAMTRLWPLLRPYACLMMDGHGVPGSCAPGSLTGQRESFLRQLARPDSALLRRVFQFAAVEECAAMARDYRWFRLRRWARLPITQPAIRVLPIWAALQYHYVELFQRKTGQVHGDLAGKTLTKPWLKRSTRPLARNGGYYSIDWLTEVDKTVQWELKASGKVQWPPSPEGVARLLHDALRRPFWRRNGWQEHYNAACTFAVCVLTPNMRNAITGSSNPAGQMYRKMCERNVELVQRSVNQLSQAIVAADSQFAAGKSIWLRRGDQDLDGLRVTDNYVTFINRYLPQFYSTPDFANPTQATVSQHIAELAQRYAALRGSFWRQRSGTHPVNITSFADEYRWWATLRAFCHDWGHWPTRWRMISLATDLTGGTVKFDPTMPDFERRPQDHPAASGEPTAHRSDYQHRVDRWLQKSADHGYAAKKEREERNKKLQYLDSRLSEPAYIETAFENFQRSAVPDSVGGKLCGQLIAAWEIN